MTTVSRFLSVRNRCGPATRLALAVLLLGAAGRAGQDEVYNARLSQVPLIGGGTPRGTGSATAMLSGTTLEVSGSFEGLVRQAGRGGGDPTVSSATAARLFAGPLTAVAGEPFAELTVVPDAEDDPPGTSGTISGSVELTPEQVESLREGRIYAQIDSDAAPEGHLWGWFLQ